MHANLRHQKSALLAFMIEQASSLSLLVIEALLPPLIIDKLSSPSPIPIPESPKLLVSCDKSSSRSLSTSAAAAND